MSYIISFPSITSNLNSNGIKRLISSELEYIRSTPTKLHILNEFYTFIHLEFRSLPIYKKIYYYPRYILVTRYISSYEDEILENSCKDPLNVPLLKTIPPNSKLVC